MRLTRIRLLSPPGARARWSRHWPPSPSRHRRAAATARCCHGLGVAGEEPRGLRDGSRWSASGPGGTSATTGWSSTWPVRRPGYRVEYVTAVTMDGSGQVVPLRGGARLQVVAIAPAYDAQGNATYHPANPRELVNVTGYATLRQVAWAGSFEGRTTIGVGVRARLPFPCSRWPVRAAARDW